MYTLNIHIYPTPCIPIHNTYTIDIGIDTIKKDKE